MTLPRTGVPARWTSSASGPARADGVGAISAETERATVEAREVRRAFGRRLVLDDISLQIQDGEIHALLGPNGSGKTTLIRVLSGLLAPSQGCAFIDGIDTRSGSRALHRALALVPSGDRSFYLRITGLENLVFFARLHGMRRRAAVAKASEVLELVGLTDAASQRVGLYSHGMQKRLSVARALLTQPRAMLVDEATHDLDPAGARVVRDLIRAVADNGTAVLWATQRIDEIRGFADRVTLLLDGSIKFTGSVAKLGGEVLPRRYLVRLRNGGLSGDALIAAAERTLAGRGSLAPIATDTADRFVLALEDDVVVGDAMGALSAGAVQVLSCTEESSELEEAFLRLTRRPT